MSLKPVRHELENPLMVSWSNHAPLSGGSSFDRLRTSGQDKSHYFAAE